MIIKISQTASNIRQLYEIESENFRFHGEAGRVSRFQHIIISNQSITIKGVYRISKWTNYIPFRYLWGHATQTRRFSLYRNDEIYASIVFSEHGFLKSCYIIALDDGTRLHCYSVAKGSFDYVCIYAEEIQIALIETYCNVDDDKYAHKLYLLEDYKRLADTLSFFVVYYASYRFAKRFHMSQGSSYTKSWTFSKYNKKYDPAWRIIHFPNENFFGKTHLFS